MNITLLNLMWRHIQRRSTQSILFIIGVMIGVAMLVSIDIANNSARRAFDLSTEAVVGKTTHEISGSSIGIDERLYQQIRTDVGWQAAAPVVTDFVLVQELDEQPLRLFGVDVFAELPFRNYLSGNGALVTASDDPNAQALAIGRFLLEANTVIIGESLAERYEIAPNDKLTLQYGDNIQTVNVVGLLRTSDSLAEQALQNLLIADISTAQEILRLTGKLTRVDLIFDTEQAPDRAAMEQIEALLPAGVTLTNASARSDAIGNMTDAFELNLTALSLLALLVGTFLVYNTVTFSVVQRRPVLGILRSLGMTRRQIFFLIWAEAAILSSIGAILGLGLGVLMGKFTVAAVTQTINDSYFTVNVQNLEISPFILLKGLVIGIGSALFAAFLPAYEATHTPPTSVTRRSDIEQKMLKFVPWITLGGLTSALVGGILLIIKQLELNLVGIFAIVLGLALVTVLATIILARLISPISGRIGGVVGRIAPRNILRNLSRTSIAITALMLSISVIIGVTAMVGSFRITVQEWLNATLKADIFISQPNNSGSLGAIPVSRDLIGEIAAVEGVEHVTYLRTVTVQAQDDPEPVILNAIMSDISEGGRKVIAGIDGGYPAILERILNGDGIMMTEVFANRRGIQWHDGLTYTLITEEGPYAFPVLGIYQDFTDLQGSVLIGLDIYERLWHDNAISNLAAYIEEDTATATVIAALQEKLAGRGLVIQSNRDLRQSALEVFDRTFAITSALNLLATIVAFIGILSALMSLQIERRREIGIMRSNGLTRRQLWKLTLWETGIMGLIAGIVAMPVGLILSIILIYIINLRSFGWSLTLNLRWEFFAQSFAVALIAAILAGLYPAWKAGSIQPVEAIRSE